MAQCGEFLVSGMGLDNCLELRRVVAASDPDGAFARSIDDFIGKNMDALRTSKELISLQRIVVEILHERKEDMESMPSACLSQLTLDWIHSQWLEDDQMKLRDLVEKKHLLRMGEDNALEDCGKSQEILAEDTEIIQDYKKIIQLLPNNNNKMKVRRHSAMKPAKPKGHHLFSRHINQEDDKTEDKAEDWRVISSSTLEAGNIVAVVTIDGRLVTCSIHQRVNLSRSDSPPSAFALATTAITNNGHNKDLKQTPAKSKSPSPARGNSAEKDVFSPLAPMAQAKCAGAVDLDGNLVVCGGFDRGECLNNITRYDIDKNAWSEMAPMLAKRGRFDVAAVNGKVIYAVAGSGGQNETNTVEKFEDGKWNYIANLPAAISNIGKLHKTPYYE